MKKLVAAVVSVFIVVTSVWGAGSWDTPGFRYTPQKTTQGTTDYNQIVISESRTSARLGKEIWVGDPAISAALGTPAEFVSALSSALASIVLAGSPSCTLHAPRGTYTVPAGGITIPANVELKVERGASFLGSGTLVINGSFAAGQYQVFAGTGTVTFGTGAVKEVQTVWFPQTTAGFTAALNSYADGSGIRFNNTGTNPVFSPSTSVTITGKSGKISCDPGVVINATASTATPHVLKFTGSVGTYYLLGGAITRGGRSFTANATLAASLSKGDLVQFTTNPSVGGAGTLWCAGVYKGEIAEVQSVSGTTVTLKDCLNDSYIAADTMTVRIAPIKMEFDNFSMIGTVATAQLGLVVGYSRDSVIRGGNVSGFGSTAIDVRSAYNFLADNVSSSDNYGGTDGFCLAINSCQIARVINCNLHGGTKQALTAGSTDVLMPNRFISFGPNNKLETDLSSSFAAVSFHIGTESSTITGNKVVGFIELAGFYCEANDNDITMNSTTGLLVYVNQNNVYLGAKRNKISKLFGTDTNTTYAIEVSLYSGATIQNVDVDNNVLIGYTGGIWVINRSGSATGTIKTLNIRGNTLKLYGTTAYPVSISGYDAGHPIAIDKLNWGGTNDVYYLNTIGIYGRYIEGTNWQLSGGSLFGDGGVANGNPINLTTSVGIHNIKLNNISFKSTASANYVYISAIDYIEVSGCAFAKFGSSGGLVLQATDMLVNNNQQVSCTGSYSLTGRYFSKLYGDGNVETWGTAAPIAGTWKVGDFCTNTSKAVGQPKAWSCTVAGTPGTWVSEGNL